MEKASLPLTITSHPRPFNQQLPEPPAPRCVLEPQDSLDLAPALVCTLCCCFGIIYCCFGERGQGLGAGPGPGAAAQSLGLGGSHPTLLSSRMMPNVFLSRCFTSSVRRCLPSEFSILPLPASHHSACLYPLALTSASVKGFSSISYLRIPFLVYPSHLRFQLSPESESVCGDFPCTIAGGPRCCPAFFPQCIHSASWFLYLSEFLSSLLLSLGLHFSFPFT